MKLASYAILAGLAATAANAGGYAAPVVEAPVTPVVVTDVEPVSDWTGFYAGVQYGKGNADEVEGISEESDIDGFGLHGGYNHDFGQFVLGGELDYNRISMDATDEDADLWRLRGRAGYDAGKFLPYATLGVAQLEGDELSETGITYGLGVDYKINEQFTVGAEYNRNDFKDVADVDGADLDTDLFQIRASYRF
ncbi:outer membrane protein [Paracoccus ravus]|uniref:outer membrane protein n=1 Tax=Paracoccus ravus TaxID=2447760 RepID=UPI00106EEA9E|nr:porin family protein [Paracoccus ravus]